MFPTHVILEGVDALPTLPEAVIKLTELVKDEHATAADFEQAVKHDAVLTANLIHAANSVFKSGSEPITSLSDAIELIGLQHLVEVAVGSSLRRTLPVRLPGYGISSAKFWIHCTAVATIAETLAHRINLPSSEMAYTAGLMHDIGQLVIGNFLAEAMPESNWWTFNTPAEERNLIGSNHCDVGKEIAIRWNLPPLIADTCRWHHELTKAPENIDTGLNAVIHASDALAFMLGFRGVGYIGGEALDQSAPARLGLTEKELLELAKSVKHAIGQNAIASGMGASLDLEASSDY
jgi:putative nucleotidyltransferase with HDIG domain